MTNVPGPREPIYFAGTRIAGVVVWVPAAGPIGLGVSIFSYNGAVTVGVRELTPAWSPIPRRSSMPSSMSSRFWRDCAPARRRTESGGPGGSGRPAGAPRA